MIDARAISQELQEQVLGQVRKGQDSVTSAVRTWAEAVQTVRPQIPGLRAPTVRLPVVADILPSPLALISGAFDLAEQLLAAQRALVEQLVDELTEQTVPPAEPILIASAAVAVEFEPEEKVAEPQPPAAVRAVAPEPAAAPERAGDGVGHLGVSDGIGRYRVHRTY